MDSIILEGLFIILGILVRIDYTARWHIVVYEAKFICITAFKH